MNLPKPFQGKSLSNVTLFAGLLLGLACALMAAPEAAAQAPAKEAPSGGPESQGPSSRLSVSGLYEADTFLQRYFFLGAKAADQQADGLVSDFDAYWTQRLNLKPRFIISDHLNINVSLDMAHGIWGLNRDMDDPDLPTRFEGSTGFFDIRFDWAYLAYRNERTRTRWYIGRQQFALGNQIVLDMDAPGIQVYRDFSRWNGSLGLGFAKQSEGTYGLTDHNGLAFPDSVTGPDGRDADLFFAEWRSRSSGGGFLINPFFIYYLDRSNADRDTYLPQGMGYLDARFRPNITRATIAGLNARIRRGALHLNLEYDYLKGADRVFNTDSGSSELLDINNGEIKGMNAFADLSLQWPRLELGAILGFGSGDPLPFATEGNFNSLRTQGHFSLTEVWADGLALDERGLAPGGLGNPFVRGYRGLENTRILQGRFAWWLRPNMRIQASYSMIRATEALKPWFDSDGNGVITPEEYGFDVQLDGAAAESDELGNEIDARIDWILERNLTFTVRYGIFMPGAAAGYLINGTARYDENAYELRAGVSVPIPEFSLGG